MEKENEQPLPPLRQSIEAVQSEQDGHPIVVIRDQEGLTEQTVALSLPGFLVATLLDGKNKLADVRSMFTQATGAVLSDGEIMKLVQDLDRAHLLETEQVQIKRQDIWKKYLESPVRKPFHAGGGYPTEPLELAAFLGKFFMDPKGPQKQVVNAPSRELPLAVIAPHIDFHRGGPAYAWAYQALSESAPPDVILGLGVAHTSPNSPWVLTKKAYETPYGPMETDDQLYSDIQSALWYEGRADEWTHRMEHSLEFQALWLKYLWRDKAPKWVPVLCSSFYEFCGDRSPSTINTVDGAIKKIGQTLRERIAAGKKILIVAGIDLAHVGPRFGDQEKLGPELSARIDKEDREAIDRAMAMDADGFYAKAVSGEGWKKYCGLSALYTTLRLCSEISGGKASGQLLTYGHANDPLGGVVSFIGGVIR